MDAYSFFIGFLQELTSRFEPVVLTKRVADGAALGFKKGIGHSAADDDIAGPFQQIFNDEYLIRDLCSPDNRSKRLRTTVQYLLRGLDFSFHQQTKHFFVRGEKLSDHSGRGM